VKPRTQPAMRARGIQDLVTKQGKAAVKKVVKAPVAQAAAKPVALKSAKSARVYAHEQHKQEAVAKVELKKARQAELKHSSEKQQLEKLEHDSAKEAIKATVSVQGSTSQSRAQKQAKSKAVYRAVLQASERHAKQGLNKAQEAVSKAKTRALVQRRLKKIKLHQQKHWQHIGDRVDGYLARERKLKHELKGSFQRVEKTVGLKQRSTEKETENFSEIQLVQQEVQAGSVIPEAENDEWGTGSELLTLQSAAATMNGSHHHHSLSRPSDYQGYHAWTNDDGSNLRIRL